MDRHPFLAELAATVNALEPELIAFRRTLHADPELSREEVRATTAIHQRLEAAGARVRLLPGTGLVADIGPDQPAYRVALRADLDALPIPERSGLDYSSAREGACHACGHDVHATVVMGAGLTLLAHTNLLAERGVAVRLIFQPAEEAIPGGALDVIAAGAMDGVDAVFAVHCDPTVDVGHVGLRVGALTAACDSVVVELSGRGGHTSRPHVTEDLTYALAKVVTDVPAALSRRLDPRAGIALVWGRIQAGQAPNVIPSEGTVAGTLRMLDAHVWNQVPALLEEVVQSVVSPYAVTARLTHIKGVPPVVNTPDAVEVLREATLAGGLVPDVSVQSLGGEDFSWLLQQAPGAMARLGTRTPGGRTYDLHQGDLVIDERAVVAGVHLLSAVALVGVVKDEAATPPASVVPRISAGS